MEATDTDRKPEPTELDWDEWDRQILRDIKDGKFDKAAQQAIEEDDAGLSEKI